MLLAKQPAASTGLKGGSRRTPASTESIDFNRILFEIQLHVHERAEGACVAASGRCKTVRVCAAKLMRLQEQVTSLFRTVSVPAPIAPDWTNAGVILVTNSQQQQQPTAQMAAQCEGNDFDRSKQQEQESSREVFLLHLEEYLQSLLQLAAALKQQQLVLFPTLSDDPLSDSTRQLCREYLGLLHQVFPTLISL